VVINLFNFFRHYKSPQFHSVIRIHLISLSYHILVILPSHFSSMEQMLMLTLLIVVDVDSYKNDRLLNCPGLIQNCELEAILFSWNINESVIPLRPEIVAHTVKRIISKSTGYAPVSARNCTDYRTARCRYVHTSSEKHGADRQCVQRCNMFPQVESLVRLLLVG